MKTICKAKNNDNQKDADYHAFSAVSVRRETVHGVELPCDECSYPDCLTPCPLEQSAFDDKLSGLTTKQKYNAKYYEKHKEKLRQKKFEYRREYPERQSESNRKYREKMKAKRLNV